MNALSLVVSYDDSIPPPVASQDLWNQTPELNTRLALRDVSDDALARGVFAIQRGLPKKILELSQLIQRASLDENSLFHQSRDTRWSSQMRSPISSPLANLASFSLLGLATTNNNNIPLTDTDTVSASATTTTRRFSISQQCALSDVSIPASISVYRPPTHILLLWEFLESQIRNVIDLLDHVQVFLILKTPVAEEGNNTGVEIQQQCSRTLVDARRFVLGCDNYLKLYHTQRAKIASKCIKYPQLEDYQRALVERDHEECRDCRYLLVRLRTQCIAVADVLHKNFDKVNDPKGLSRGGASVGMY